MGISSPPPLAESDPRRVPFSPVPDSMADRDSHVQAVDPSTAADVELEPLAFDDEPDTGEFNTPAFIDEYESQLEMLRSVASQQALDVSPDTQDVSDIDPDEDSEPPTLRKRPAFVSEKQFQSQPERPLRDLPDDFGLSSDELK